MRWTNWILLLCLTATLSAMASDNVVFVSPSGEMDVALPRVTTLDDAQPDTLLYDDGVAAILNTGANYWCQVRFTPLVDFNIISAYLRVIDGAGTTHPCSLFVYTTTPAPGGEMGTAVRPGALPENGWIDVNFNDTVTVTANVDFYVIFGPVPGGGQNDNSWNSIADGGSTSNRSSLTAQDRFGVYNIFQYDWMLRIGGTFANSFVDLESGDLSNDIGSGPSFNFLSGHDVTLGHSVTNIGTGAADPFIVDFSVRGPSGSTIYTEEVIASGLPAGGTTDLATSDFAADEEGEYLARAIVVSGQDGAAENDTSWLRFFVGGNHRWYRYDDDLNPDSYLSFQVGSGWATRFEPAVYPAKLTQIRINVNGAATGTVSAWAHPSDTLPASPSSWTTNAALAQGWNTINVNPPVFMFEGQSVTVGYFFATGAAMGFDLTPPIAAEIEDMGGIGFQTSGVEPTTFTRDNSGNMCIQAYVDTTTQAPPFPFIATSDDTLEFGAVHPSWPAVTRSLWVHNVGSSGNISVSNIRIPTGVAAAFSATPTTFTVEPLDSQEVVVSFDPPIHRMWTGNITIVSNAQNDTSFTVYVRGQADTTLSVHETSLPLPSQFALGQNYPNPFNPSTEIQFSLPVQSNVRLTVVNMLGQEVATIADGRYSAGVYRATFDGANLPSGLYFYRIVAGDFTSVRKMMLLK